MLRKHWPKIAKVYWCPNCNIPLVSSKCSKCGGVGVEVKLREPADARLAFKRDIEIALEASEEKFGTEKVFKSVMGESEIILLNKTTHIDDAKELVINGNYAGILLFNPFTLKWEFRPSYYGALRILNDKVAETIIIKDKVKENEIIPFKGESIDEGKYVILADPSDNPLGLGLVLKNGKIRVIKRYRYRFVYEIPNVRATLDDVLKGNIEKLEKQVEEATAFIEKISSKVGKPVIVSFSGGKDSLVSLHLTLRSIGEPLLLFNNTGIELSETVETVMKISEKYGLKLKVADAGNAFWDSVEIFGPPARDYRWCCKVAKLVPLAKKMLKEWPMGALNIVGQRAYESLERAKSTRIWRNKWVPLVINASPIQYWSQLSIWLYIFKEKLLDNVNPLYFKGFDRIGCFMCPASRLAEFEEVKKTHPKLWSKWESFLCKWARKIGAPREWITLGLWRWLGPVAPKKVLSKKTTFNAHEWYSSYSKWIDLKPVEFNEDKISFRLRFNKQLNLEAISSIAVILGKTVKFTNSDVIEVSADTLKYVFRGEGKVEVATYKPQEKIIEEFLDAVKIVYRAYYCVDCGSCVTLCPANAINIVNKKPIVSKAKCLNCRACNDVCPISEVIVEKLIAALIFKKYDAWRRRTKRSRYETAQLLAELMRKIKLSSPPITSGSNK